MKLFATIKLRVGITPTAACNMTTWVEKNSFLPLPTSLLWRLIRHTEIAETLFSGRRRTRFVEGEKANFGLRLNCMRIRLCSKVRCLADTSAQSSPTKRHLNRVFFFWNRLSSAFFLPGFRFSGFFNDLPGRRLGVMCHA